MGVKEDYVFSQMESGDICVFPSEVSARGWLISYARKRGAVFAEQAISYDDFCKRFLNPGSKTKASRMIRYLFLSDAVESHAVSLPYFIPTPQQGTPRLIRYLSTLLPQLKLFHDQGRVGDAMSADYETLYQAYRQFLASHDVYEPSYETPTVPKDHGVFRVLFPEAQLGFSRLYAQLGKPGWIKPCPFPGPEKKPVLYSYANHVAEVRGTLRRIHKLLSDGVPARDILISSARPEIMIPALEADAQRYGVPLVTRMGANPLVFPAGRFFQMVLNCYQNQMAYGDVEALLLDPGLPYAPEKRKLSEQLMQFAVKQVVDQGDFLDAGKDLWLRELVSSLIKKDDCDEGIKDHYKKLKDMVGAMARATDAKQFLVAFHSYQDAFFRKEGWTGLPDEDLATFCFDAVESLQQELDAVGARNRASFLALFVDYLRNKPYNPQKKDAEGVGVYRWTDSAALCAPYHFFLSMDWDGTQRVDKPLSCLPDTLSQEERLEEDLTTGYLAMAGSEGSILSFHRADYSGQCMAPAWFDEVKEIRAGFDMEGNPAIDPWNAEQDFWKDGRRNLRHGIRTQQEAMERAEEAGLLEQYRTPQGIHVVSKDPRKVERVSSTALDAHHACPMRYASQYLLKAEANDYQIGVVDVRTLGLILHKTYEAFYGSLQEPFFVTAEKQEEYRTRLTNCFSQAVTFYMGKGNPTVVAWVTNTWLPLCLAELEKEMKQFPGNKTVATEQKHFGEEVKVSVAGHVLTLIGQIDRVLQTGDGRTAVIDYKENHGYVSLGKPDIFKQMTEAEKGEKLTSTQLPFYDALSGGKVDIAAYYSVKEKRFIVIWDDVHPEMKPIGSSVLMQRLKSFVSDMESGRWDFTKDTSQCKETDFGSCPWRSVCRRRYSTL